MTTYQSIPDTVGKAIRRAKLFGIDAKVRFSDDVTVEFDGKTTKQPGTWADLVLYRNGKNFSRLAVRVPERELDDAAALDARLNAAVHYLLSGDSRDLEQCDVA